MKSTIGPIIARAVCIAAMLCTGRAEAAAPAVVPLGPQQIDALVERAMRTFSVPGAAVGIIQDGKVVYSRGYGVRTLGKQEPVDGNTVFAIGSISKGLTTAALAMLVDEGRLHWDDRIVDLLPEFQLMDPWTTREITLRDLLLHRSGLAKGAGDLMFVPQTDFSRAEVMHALRYLKPATSFRSQFAYDNLLYMVAGEIIPSLTGQSWEQFVDTRVLGPARMRDCAASAASLPARAVLATPHSMVDGTLTAVPPLDLSLVAAAGSAQCNVAGLVRFLQAQLADGQLPDGQRLYSAERQHEMWTPQALMPVGGERAAMTRTHFQAYGLGWVIQDFAGFKRVYHNGGVIGMVTHVSMVPELKLGVIVLTNQQDPWAVMAIADSIVESYATLNRHDWVSFLEKQSAAVAQAVARADAAATVMPLAVQPDSTERAVFAGTYRDAWRGEVTVRESGSGLELSFSRTHGLHGTLVAVGPDLFVVRWSDRSLHADAYVRFARGYDGVPESISMQAVSAATDSSFDFGDLHLSRVDRSSP